MPRRPHRAPDPAQRRPRAKGLTKRQKKEVDDLTRFIDAHGGRLAPFRGYYCRPSAPPPDDDAK
jgi:hypothetical protein